jgi:hypothetical protein
MKKLHEKDEHELLIAFLGQLELEQGQQLVPNAQRYIHRVLAYDLYELITGKKYMPDEMRRINIRMHTIDNNILMAEIDNFLLTHPSWP